jgi:para-nitrobenzyl esterase
MMAGALSDEYYGLQAGAAEISETELDNYLTRAFGVAGTGLKADYTELIAQSPVAARKTIAGDNGFMRTARDWARLVSSHGDDAYVYYFSRAVPVFRLYVPERPALNDDSGARTLGAYHSGELAFVFDNLDIVGIGWDEADHALSETVADYWFNFASTGNPNGAGLPDWPAYDSALDGVQVLDAEISNAQHPRKQFMDRIDKLAAP